MKIRRPSRGEFKKILFAWDGTVGAIKIADRFANTYQNALVKAVHVMPHEGVYSYCTVGHSSNELSAHEKQLYEKFSKAAKRTKALAHVKLEFLFGERIVEIVRLATVIKAELILLPRFEQSIFSSWIHGDLNERLQAKAPCSVISYRSSDAVPIQTES